MTTVWIVDIDRTIADFSHREHYLRKSCVACGNFDINSSCSRCGCDIFETPTKSWKAFTDPNLLRLDRPILEAQDVIFKAMSFNVHVHYITGRQPQARTVTQQWLEDNFGFDIRNNKLLMREVDSYTQDKSLHIPASKHKESKFKQLMEICGYTDRDSFSFFDDDDHVLPMYSKYGLTFKAPDCWNSMIVKTPHTSEPLFNK